MDVIIIRIIMCHHAMKRFMVFLELPDTPEEKVGSLRHPGEKSHGYAAEVNRNLSGRTAYLSKIDSRILTKCSSPS